MERNWKSTVTEKSNSKDCYDNFKKRHVKKNQEFQLKPCYVRLIKEDLKTKPQPMLKRNQMKNCYIKLKTLDLNDGLIFKVAKEKEQKSIAQELLALKKCYVKLDELDLSKCENPEVNRAQINNIRNVCPPYNFIENTNFVVDAFNYDNLEHIQHFFLSCYRINNKFVRIPVDFNKNIYLSEITGKILTNNLNINPRCLNFMPINKPIKIDDVEVTALDAQKYPGNVMFLFRFKSGKCILYTGEFCANPFLEEYPAFWNNEIDVLYLNTRCLSPGYNQSIEDDGFEKLIYHCDELIEKNLNTGTRCIIVYGSNIIETKIWLKLAHNYSFNVFIDGNYKKFLECVNDTNIMDVLTSDINKAGLHIVSSDKLNLQSLQEYLHLFDDVYNLLAIQVDHYDTSIKIIYDQYPIKVIGLNYEEHSSLANLNRFISFLKPKDIISTTPF